MLSSIRKIKILNVWVYSEINTMWNEKILNIKIKFYIFHGLFSSWSFSLEKRLVIFWEKKVLELLKILAYKSMNWNFITGFTTPSKKIFFSKNTLFIMNRRKIFKIFLASKYTELWIFKSYEFWVLVTSPGRIETASISTYTEISKTFSVCSSLNFRFFKKRKKIRVNYLWLLRPVEQKNIKNVI